MERSRSGFLEPISRRTTANAQRVQLIIRALSECYTGENAAERPLLPVQPDYSLSPAQNSSEVPQTEASDYDSF